MRFAEIWAGGPQEQPTDEAVAARSGRHQKSGRRRLPSIDRELAQESELERLPESIERRIEQLQRGPSASTLKSIEKAENEIAPLQATKDKLERMQTLLPNILEGPLSGIAGTVSRYGPASWRNPSKRRTHWNSTISPQIETIRDMSRTMKGSTAVKEMDVWLTKAADPKLPKEDQAETI